MGHLADLRLPALLESYLSTIQPQPIQSESDVFFARRLPVLHGKLPKRGTSFQRLDNDLSEMLRRLFPKEADSALVDG